MSYLFAGQSVEQVVIHRAPTNVSRRLLNLLISISSNTEYIPFSKRVDMYKWTSEGKKS